MFTRDAVVLVLVDVQEKLLPAIHQHEQVLGNICRLLRGMAVLGIPVLHTEQYPAGLGSTVPAAAALLTETPLQKDSFSCCGDRAFLKRLSAVGRPQVLLAGIETHVCVSQTALDLLETNYVTGVVADAAGSRTPKNHGLALQRLSAAGAQVVSVEMILLELLQRADAPEFKQILKLIK